MNPEVTQAEIDAARAEYERLDAEADAAFERRWQALERLSELKAKKRLDDMRQA